MRIVVFDTETTSIDKPFVYNIGYIIYDTETKSVLQSHDFVVKQIWYNRELFSTAYYSDKKKIYINRMRGKACELEYLGYITQLMCREFKAYGVESAFAYNSPFDDRVFEFNCEWFKVKNPFDDIPIYDIRGYVFKGIAFTKEYKDFCEKYSLFTESKNYSTSAENVYKFLTNNPDFAEEHTALSDSEIELEILIHCIEKCGCALNTEYKIYNSVPRDIEKTLIVKNASGKKFCIPYKKIRVYKEKNDKTRIYLR